MYQELDDGYLANLYNLKIINKTFEDRTIDIRLRSPEGRIKLVGGKLEIQPNNILQSAFFIEIPNDRIRLVRTPVFLEIYSQGEKLDELSTSFIGPDKYKGGRP
jgi:hypothetical protein